MMLELKVLDHGHVKLTNLAGPIRRLDKVFDADDTDPANSARMSFDQSNDPSRLREEDLRLCEYLYKNRHTTPFEMVECWFEMKLPIFVARQLVRHRTVSINEVSARYTKLENAFYIPEIRDVGVKSESNKQGRTMDDVAGHTKYHTKVFCERLEDHCNNAYFLYDQAIGSGVPNELARCFLPVNIYTKWLWKQDLHNLMHMMTLRRHEHAQFEIQAYANACHNILSQCLPATMAMFDGYQIVMQKKLASDLKG